MFASLAAVALLAVPAGAFAKDGGSGKPEKAEKTEKTERAAKKHDKRSYVLKGTLSAFTPASSAGNGTITITVAKANKHGRALKGMSLTFVVTSRTKVRIDSDGAIANGERGIVKLKGPKGLDAAGLQALPARQVIDKEESDD
ncbi:MAG: hypothetical protein ABR583_09975 [Gaiellaceae bacterium]